MIFRYFHIMPSFELCAFTGGFIFVSCSKHLIMEIRLLPGTNIEISQMTFGAWAIGGWMWGGADKRAAMKAIRAAYEAGITSFDTAPVYGFGQSEALIGEALKDVRSKVQLLTKYSLSWDEKSPIIHYADTLDNNGKPIVIYRNTRKEKVIWECEQSLRRLKSDYIDLYQQHWPVESMPIEETMEAIERLKQQGKIRASGLSNFSTEQFAEADKWSSSCISQLPFSMIKRDIVEAFTPYAKENNKGILAYSPLQRGLLTGKYKPGHQFSIGDHRASVPYFKDEALKNVNAFLDSISPIAFDNNLSLSQLVIQWTARQELITSVLVGARTEDQVLNNVKAFDSILSATDMAQIDIELSKLTIKA